MSRRIDLLRLDYLFSVLLPIITAIYLNGLNPLDHMDILVGFSLLAITGNVWNDYVDMKDPNEKETRERTRGYHPKDLLAIGAMSLMMGLLLLSRTCLQYPINGLFLVIIIVAVLSYIKFFKPTPIVNHILLILSHIVLPYLMIMVDSNLIVSIVDIVAIIAIVTFGLTGQFLHEVIDNDSIRETLNIKQCVILVWIFAIITIISGSILLVVTMDYYLLLIPLAPLGILYGFRSVKKLSKGMKDMGILGGNFIMFYFICLIVMQMRGII